jgi:hypothetical protein
MKVFSERGMTAAGKVLTYDEFYERSGWRDLTILPEKAEKIIEKAEMYLDEPIPMLTLSMYHDFFVSGSRNPFVSEHIKRRAVIGTGYSFRNAAIHFFTYARLESKKNRLHFACFCVKRASSPSGDIVGQTPCGSSLLIAHCK